MNWLSMANEALDVSTSFVDNNYRRRWEDNLRMFGNQHPIDSKYVKESYKYRSKLFRPKSRSVVRNTEAATSQAFFSSSDAVNLEAFDPNNEVEELAAEFRNYLLNHHLQETVPWYLTVIGGMQDAQVMGVVASKQYWKIKSKKTKEVDQDGNQFTLKQRVVDKPAIDLLAVENVRIDPASDWRDPINTSPYVIIENPMYAYEVKEKAESGEWNKVTDKQLAASKAMALDSTRYAREKREDSKEARYGEDLKMFDIVWVNEVIIHHNGEDWVYYTLGKEAMLTEPKRLSEEYLHNVRPVVIGTAVLETHKIYPQSPIELGKDLQKEANEIANQRLDNVKLVLNKRYFAKRGSQVDLKSLVRNVPASVTLMNDVTDVLPVDFNDVTGSSYAEQDRVNADYDELLGSFSGGSVQTNRKLNETVRGMAMLRDASNGVTQYVIEVFSVTWVTRVVKQFDQLIQNYETDRTLLERAANSVGVDLRTAVQLLSIPLKAVVNVANSATDPVIRLDQLLSSVERYAQVVQIAPPELDTQEIGKEIFGRLGYREGKRFFKKGEDPRIAQMQQAIQEMQAVIKEKQIEHQSKAQIEEMKQEHEMELTAFREEAETERKEMDIEAKIALEEENGPRTASQD